MGFNKGGERSGWAKISMDCSREKIFRKQVSVGTTMRPGSRLMVAEEGEVVMVLDIIDGPHEAWG